MNLERLHHGSTSEKISAVSALARAHWDHPERLVPDVLQEVPPRPNDRPIGSVGIFFHGFGLGGGEIICQNLADRLQRMGYRVVLITQTSPSEEDLELPPDVTRRVVPCYLDVDADSYEVRGRALATIYEEEGLDCVVFAHCFPSTLAFDLMLTRSMGLRSLVYVQNSFTIFLLDRHMHGRDIRIPFSYRLADAVVCLTPMDQLHFEAFSQRVFVTPNPPTFAAPTCGAPLSGHRVLWPARIKPDKYPDRAIQILQELVPLVPDVELWLVGPCDPDYREELTELAEAKGVLGHLCIDAPRLPDQMASVYAQADAYLLTSRYEGWCLALEEAMAHGVPCVMYALPNLPLGACEAVIQIPQDDAKAAAEALAQLLENKELARSLGQEERRFVQPLIDFDFEALWRQLLGPLDPVKPESDTDRLRNAMVREEVAAAAEGTDQRSHKAVDQILALQAEVAGLRAQVSHLEDSRTLLEQALGDSQKQADALCGEIEALKGSVSFKVGRTVTALPRGVRELVCAHKSR